MIAASRLVFVFVLEKETVTGLISPTRSDNVDGQHVTEPGHIE